MAEAIANIRIGSVQVELGGTNLGYTGEDTSLTVGTEYANIMVDKYGHTLVDKRIVGRTVTVTMTLKQTSKSDLTDVWAKVFPENTSASAAKIVLGDETNESMRDTGAVLVLQRRNAADDTEDFTIWKAVPTEVGEIGLNNEGESTLPVTFEGLIDETNGLFTFGDSDGA